MMSVNYVSALWLTNFQTALVSGYSTLHGHMEKLEMETGNENQKQKLKTEMEMQPLAVVVIQMLLVFIPRHPSALPSPVFCLSYPQL